MNRAYIFVYNDDVGTQDKVKQFIDGRPEIVNWMSDLPNCFYLISPNSAQELSAIIRGFTGAKGRFLVMECNHNRQGYLPRSTWTFLREKKGADD